MAAFATPDPYLTLNASSMALDARGRIIFAGEVDDDIPAVWRVLPDGTLDPAFGSAGIAIARGAYGPFPAWWWSIAFDGAKIVLGGMTDDEPPLGTGAVKIAVLARLDDNGVPDPSFGTRGFPRAAGSGPDGRGRAGGRQRKPRAPGRQTRHPGRLDVGGDPSHRHRSAGSRIR
ncbi:MAG TPA: hypothetical protein VFD90_00090 [Gaiellales bacterium]|nr:hypothetical protein [Gaiellales bacterium]